MSSPSHHPAVPGSPPGGPFPTRALVDALAVDQGLDFLSDVRRDAALAQHTSMRSSLLELRRAPMAYVGEVLEPAHALTWLDATGGTR